MFFRFPVWLRPGKKASSAEAAAKAERTDLSRTKDFSARRAKIFGAGWIPRTETLILLVGLACTVCGKLIIIQRQKPPSLFIELAQVVFPDILFFAAALLVISCLYILRPTALAARCALVIAALVSAWSVLNFGWLIKAGVQLQPGILKLFIRDPAALWPLVKPHLMIHLRQVILLGVAIFGVCAYLLWCFFRPDKVAAIRMHHARRAALLTLAIIALLPVGLGIRSDVNLGSAGKVLDFSSHWHALVSTVAGPREGQHPSVQTRHIPRVGQCQVITPKCPPNDLPNVVLVLLESISYSVSSLGDAEPERMPYLARLAADGVEFRPTRVILPYTTKAFWTVLTSTTPAIQPDYVEAIPVDEPYESLASLLGRAGYRSAFFEMSKGSFECAPGLFSNLAFDWAWFRENLEDPSAHLGHLTGDDCRMLKPAFEWALKGSQPFFLMMITSVAHDPFSIPKWFDKPKEKPYERYIQAVRYTDYFLGQVCQALKAHGLEENTILCVLGDHGTSFQVQERKGRWVPYEEVIRVPWVIHWPGHIEAGQVIDWPCSQLDVTPTILKLIGFDITRAGFEGKDAFTPSEPNRRLYFSSWYSDSPMGFVEANRKVVYWPYLDKVFEYDLDADPKEENPRTVLSDEAEQIKRDILDWQRKSQITIDAKRYTERFLFSHWQAFSAGRTAWAYYVP